ncbi:MAG: FAD-dependent oxidoreductase [Deltaproteobacteria bacterium]|nr:FAD-dependent oxidoreductase [Deltaproteobacteria bacterium]MBW2051932.1 FAD-dependent oxidoreductase [Deltaproteobacteria bacterium]MBW2140339.1 FAD-dependent oxidoreductase [Deltaproteobacteria bacterium]MBW2323568.1 FAD-dependent oxidoreductase [Deltaproteobacteria bacterium]
MKFVVIGGDAAGMSAASRAKRNKSDLEVTVLEQTADVSYSACGMPYNIADPNRAIEDLVVREAQVFREKQGIDLRTGHRVEAIDRAARVVTGHDNQGNAFELKYDKLLIATGGSPIIPDRPGFGLPGVLALKNLNDGRVMKEYIQIRAVKKAVIIGMGYIALEMAEALRARDIEVHMVKPRPILLPWMNRELASMIEEELQANGVQLHLGQDVTSIEKVDDRLKVICADMKIECQLVLVAIGVKPNSEIAEDAGLELGPKKAIAVDRAMHTSDQDVFAAGDCADAYHVVTGQKTWIPLALRANRAGWAVADNVIGKTKELPGVAGTAVFKVFYLEVARTGLTSDEASAAGFDPAEVVITGQTKAHAHPGSSIMRVQMVGDRKSGRLLGVQMVAREGAAHRINAPAVALHSQLTVEAYSQTDLAYAPPFGPVWDPTLTAANQLLKKLR